MNKKRPSTSGEIIRVQHDRAHPYVVSSRALPEDERLSWAARGLLWYLLAKPDNWQVMFNDLLRAGEARRDKMRALLKELETVGYLGRERSHNAQGHWQWVSTIYENPADREPCPDLPGMVEPSMVQPSTVKASIQESRNGHNNESNNKPTATVATKKESEQIHTVETDRPATNRNGSDHEADALRGYVRSAYRKVSTADLERIVAAWHASGQPAAAWWHAQAPARLRAGGLAYWLADLQERGNHD